MNIFNYLSKKISELKVWFILNKYKNDTESFENGRKLGYSKGFIDGTELRAQRNGVVSKEDHDGLLRYLTIHNLEFYYTSKSPEVLSGLMIRYKEKNT